MNVEVSAQYLEMILKKNPEAQIILFWDRAPLHRGKPIKKVLEGHPRLEIIFFPTASPDLNPGQHVWKAVRKQVSQNHLETRLPEITDRFLNNLNSGIFKDIFLTRYGYSAIYSLSAIPNPNFSNCKIGRFEPPIIHE
jgi:transposase